MKAVKLIAFVSVIGFTMGAKHSLKQKLAERGNVLAQAQAQTGAQAEGGPWSSCNPCGRCCECPCLDTSCPGELDAPDCNCTAGIVGGDFPPLGSGEFNPTEIRTVLSTNQDQVFLATPDTSFTAIDEAACCACENALHQAGVNATKVRKFGIHGDICVTECIQYVENGCAEEASRGRSHKNSIHQENALDGGLGAGDNCTNFTLTVCSPPQVTTSG